MLTDYLNNVKRLEQVFSTVETWNCNLGEFFSHSLDFILNLIKLEKQLFDDFFIYNTETELRDLNSLLFSEIMPENYAKSFCDPAYCAKLFGIDLGRVLSAFAAKKRAMILPVFKHQKSLINLLLGSWIDLFDAVDNRVLDYKNAKKVLSDFMENYLAPELMQDFILSKDPSDSYFISIAEKSDLQDLRYLYKYGAYISENEIKTARFFNKLSDDKVNSLAKIITDAYIRGFKNSRKDIRKKNTVTFNPVIGQEKLIRAMSAHFRELDIAMVIGRISSTIPNRQFVFDHKYDFVYYCNADYYEKASAVFSELVEKPRNKSLLEQHSGNIFVISFGERPFSPYIKKEASKAMPEQNELMREHQVNIFKILRKYWLLSEISYTMIAFPSPEIGDRYEDIFAEMIKVNSLDNNLYENIHKCLIDALDKGEYIHIKGKNGNQTDILVKLQPLHDPVNETNFYSYLSDINIPLGEVATSPQLNGTHGVLHLHDAYLKGLHFKNLKFTFKDGYTKEYSCDNFDTKDACEKYIQDNIMGSHNELPIGEFAIGTNTLAYAMAEKYNIFSLLPILIIEKTGPHIAIGDTCYTWEEDIAAFNPDGKKIMARDNERSILRKNDISRAYTYCHTDVTLPYCNLDFIKVLCRETETYIFKNGRFVLRGTEELNKPFFNCL